MVGRGETGGFRNPGWWRRPRAVAEWAREAGPLWPMTTAALVALGVWIVTSWRVGVFVAGVLLFLVGVLYELRDRAWRRQARGASAPAPDSTRARIMRDDLGMPGIGGIQAPQALTQDDYVALLERDQDRARDAFVMRQPADVDDYEWDCRRCHQRAVTLVIHHPIWDGPHENAGSGVVDTRVTPYCPRCDAFTIALAWGYGLEPSAPLFDMLSTGIVTGRRLPGIPLRLPWTGVGAIRLHTALWLRAPFHNLLVQVERAVPPPPAPKDQPHPYTVTPPTIDATGKLLPCEVCGRPFDDALHVGAPTP